MQPESDVNQSPAPASPAAKSEPMVDSPTLLSLAAAPAAMLGAVLCVLVVAARGASADQGTVAGEGPVLVDPVLPDPVLADPVLSALSGGAVAAGLALLLPVILFVISRGGRRLPVTTLGVATMGASMGRLLLTVALGLAMQRLGGLAKEPFWITLAVAATAALVVETGAAAVSLLNGRGGSKRTTELDGRRDDDGSVGGPLLAREVSA